MRRDSSNKGGCYALQNAAVVVRGTNESLLFEAVNHTQPTTH